MNVILFDELYRDSSNIVLAFSNSFYKSELILALSDCGGYVKDISY